MQKFAYLIYDTESLEVFEMYDKEDECVHAYNAKYDGFKNVDWIGLNLRFVLSKWFVKDI